jgi:hypothetical protein
MKILEISKTHDKNFMHDITFEHGIINDYEESYAKIHTGKISTEAVIDLKSKDLI